jgi:hypothetical protein
MGKAEMHLEPSKKQTPMTCPVNLFGDKKSISEKFF